MLISCGKLQSTAIICHFKRGNFQGKNSRINLCVCDQYRGRLTPTAIIAVDRAYQYKCAPNWHAQQQRLQQQKNTRRKVWKQRKGQVGLGSLPKGHINTETHTGSYCSKVTTKGLRFFCLLICTAHLFVLFKFYCCLIMFAVISLKISSRLLLFLGKLFRTNIYVFFFSIIQQFFQLYATSVCVSVCLYEIVCVCALFRYSPIVASIVINCCCLLYSALTRTSFIRILLTLTQTRVKKKTSRTAPFRVCVNEPHTFPQSKQAALFPMQRPTDQSKPLRCTSHKQNETSGRKQSGRHCCFDSLGRTARSLTLTTLQSTSLCVWGGQKEKPAAQQWCDRCD